MNISITDQMLSQFLSGVLTVVVLIAVGGMLSILLKPMNQKFMFTRLALILGLTPLALVNFIDPGNSSTLYLFPMILALLGITVDGINFLLMPKERIKTEPVVEKADVEEDQPDPGVIVWEKAN
jgi:hypothetical protein